MTDKATAEAGPVQLGAKHQRCPQRGNRSEGSVANYAAALMRGYTLAQIGETCGVSAGAVRKALKAAGMPTQSRALLAAIPEGCTPTDAHVLRAANHALAQENHELKAKLRKVRDALAWIDD